MRILGAVFFLSLLAGKFNKFAKILLTESKENNSARVFFVSFSAGK